jgi:hypothetical protein
MYNIAMPATMPRNPYHFLEDIITAFISLAVVYGPDPPSELLRSGIEFVFTDGLGPGHYMEVRTDMNAPKWGTAWGCGRTECPHLGPGCQWKCRRIELGWRSLAALVTAYALTDLQGMRGHMGSINCTNLSLCSAAGMWAVHGCVAWIDFLAHLAAAPALHGIVLDSTG